MPESVFAGRALTVRSSGSVLEVELHREPCNEIGTTALDEFERVVELMSEVPGVRAMVMYSSVSRGFCAGADLRELHAGIVEQQTAGTDVVQHEVRRFIERIHRVFSALDRAPITTVAALHGFCFGGGFELALTCDVRVADKSARFCFPELRLGLVPGFGGIPRLRRDVGNGVIRDLLLTGRSLNAARAHEIGLVSQVVGRGEALEIARQVAAQSAKFDAATVARAKAFIKPDLEAELAHERDLFVAMMASPTVEASLRRFVTSSDVRPYLP